MSRISTWRTRRADLAEARAVDILDATKVDLWRGAPSFALRNRIYRGLWSLVWTLFACWTFPRWHAWRRFLLRAFGARVAPSALIAPSVKVWSPANLEVGENVIVSSNVILYSMARITIERDAVISPNAHLCTGTHDIEDIRFQLVAYPIVIGSQAWIAAEAFVGPGVTVGTGAILGARGCTFRNLTPWTVNVGNPARHTRVRGRNSDLNQA